MAYKNNVKVMLRYFSMLLSNDIVESILKGGYV